MIESVVGDLERDYAGLRIGSEVYALVAGRRLRFMRFHFPWRFHGRNLISCVGKNALGIAGLGAE